MNLLSQKLKSNFHYIILIILIITMTIVLFIRDEKELIIISKDYVYSVYHSNNYETIDIELLTNNVEDFHFEKKYIISSKIYNQNQELSVDISKISSYNESIQVLDQEFKQVMIELKLPFVSNDYLLEIEDAYLEIIYDNNETINISIGEINYLFLEDYGKSISLGNLSATHEEFQGVNTVGGVNIELGNQSDYNINITNIDILSQSIHINKDYIIQREACEYTNTAKTCLDLEYNVNNESLSEKEINILLTKNNSISLYLPLTYSNNYNFIYEFALLIDYEINGIESQIVIDDFPYMSTSIFSSFSEDDIHVYTILR